jgi:hypothetical protein
MNSTHPELGTVSVVVSTYNRPDALLAALSSVSTQSYPIHEIIVVGDCCDEATGIALAELADPRIRYINLEKRHGDQSGPNNRGVRESTGEWVAFLNHDDFWFPDHIKNALSELSFAQKKWFCGIARFSFEVSTISGRLTPVVTEKGLMNRRMMTAYSSTLRYMEPASAWVVSRKALCAAGNWPFAAMSVRTPVSFLALTLWRKIGSPIWGVTHSVLKVQGSLQQKLGGEYNSPSPLHRELQATIESKPRDWFIGLAEKLSELQPFDAPLESNYGNVGLAPLPRWALVLAALVFRGTGFDFLDFRLRRAGIRRGQLMDQILQGRTGEVRDSARTWLENQRGRG